MTTPVPFGRTLALAERTLTAVLRHHLAERDTTPETWYALQLIATRGPGLDRAALSEDLAGSRALNADSTRELLARLEAEGLIRGVAAVDLTADGERTYRSLRDYIAIPTAQLLSQFEADDIDTTVRTLQAITERAEAGLAARSSAAAAAAAAAAAPTPPPRGLPGIAQQPLGE
jgi:DNA-binding MarR family transcriptional regulator